MADNDNDNDNGKTPRLYQKTLDAFKLIEAGLTPREALQAANMVTKVSDQAVCNLKKKLKKYSLSAPKTVSLAHHQIRRILAAQAREVARQKVTNDGQVIDYTEQIVPTDTNILAAASMVYDRYEPINGDGAAPEAITYLDFSAIQINVSGAPAAQSVLLSNISVIDIPPTGGDNDAQNTIHHDITELQG